MISKLRITLMILLVFCVTIPFLIAGDPTEYFGTVKKKTGAAVTIHLDDAHQIAEGDRLDVYVFFKKNIFGMETTGWLYAAEATLARLNDTTAVIRVIREKSPMTVNDKKVEHLTPGTKVKLILK